MQETSPCKFDGSIKRHIEIDGEVASNGCELLEDGESDGLLGIMLTLTVEALDATNDLAY